MRRPNAEERERLTLLHVQGKTQAEIARLFGSSACGTPLRRQCHSAQGMYAPRCLGFSCQSAQEAVLLKNSFPVVSPTIAAMTCSSRRPFASAAAQLSR